jgi:tight adherence protein C
LNQAFAKYLTIHVAGAVLSPADTIIFALALAAALLSGFRLWHLVKQEARRQRLAALRGVASRETDSEARSIWYERLGSIVAASPAIGKAEQQRLLRALAAAGIKGHGRLAAFVASKVCTALLLAALVWVYLEWSHWLGHSTMMRMAAVAGALMLGWRFPDLVLGRLAARRRLRLEQGIPDALDLLVVCAEAGLSLDQAIDQVSQDLRSSNRAVAEEFATTAAEMRVLSSRAEALANLVERTGLANLRSITATLGQAIRFGTPLAESLRTLAAEMRNERLLRIEERAGRLPVLLAMPLACFIFPSLMIVIGTPVALRVMDTLNNTPIFRAP